jgi:hypothetical protein
MDELMHDLKRAGLEAFFILIALAVLGAFFAPYFGWTPSTSGEGPMLLLLALMYTGVRSYLLWKRPT